jgi:5-carboxymethyl-2-hydroxymuconate isomerase
MPHFIIDCSENILQERTAEELMNAVYEVAASTGLFAANDIKVRLQSNQHFKLGEGKTSFIHVFGYIMEGRSLEQKANLSRNVTAKLVELVKDTSFLSMNIWDFERETYCNKSLINPANKNKDRHFEL